MPHEELAENVAERIRLRHGEDDNPPKKEDPRPETPLLIPVHPVIRGAELRPLDAPRSREERLVARVGGQLGRGTREVFDFLEPVVSVGHGVSPFLGWVNDPIFWLCSALPQEFGKHGSVPQKRLFVKKRAQRISLVGLLTNFRSTAILFVLLSLFKG